MKTQISLVAVLCIILWFNALSLRAQPCFPEGISFETQSQIDNFSSNYPDCTEIEGQVLIAQSFDNFITDLDGLSQIISIGGRLGIIGNTSLENLNGLENLKSIGGEFEVSFNDNLKTLGNLSSLEHIGSLKIFYNLTLEDFGNVPQLDSIAGHISIYYNFSLTRMTEFKIPEIVYSDINIGGSTMLENLENFSTLKECKGLLSVVNNDSLKNLNGFQNLESAGGGILINNNPQIKNLSGFSSLKRVGSFNIYNNFSLENLSGLEQLEEVIRDFNITYNYNLKSLKGLDRLNFIGGSLRLFGLDSLKNLEGLEAFQNPQGLEGLEIVSNPNLESLHGIDQMQLLYIPNIWIFNNPELSYCHVQSVCDYVSFCGNNLELEGNDFPCELGYAIEEKCLEETDPDFRFHCIESLAPNPANDFLDIKFRRELTESPLYEISDANGRVLYAGVLQEGRLNIAGLAAGVYYFRIISDKHADLRRFIKI